MRNVLFLVLFLVSFICNSCAQKTSKEYFIGKWKSIDSLTGAKYKVQFKRNNIVHFNKVKKNTISNWNYVVQDLDSIILLKYNIHFSKSELENEATLVIQNATCFWWFNTIDYNKYVLALKNGDNISHKDKFDAWLKESRGVYYKVNSN
jgi:hypothetical protein